MTSFHSQQFRETSTHLPHFTDDAFEAEFHSLPKATRLVCGKAWTAVWEDRAEA